MRILLLSDGEIVLLLVHVQLQDSQAPPSEYLQYLRTMLPDYTMIYISA